MNEILEMTSEKRPEDNLNKEELIEREFESRLPVFLRTDNASFIGTGSDFQHRALKYFNLENKSLARDVSQKQRNPDKEYNLAEYLDSQRGFMRLRFFLNETLITAKGLGATRLRQKFLKDAVEAIEVPTEKERNNGYNHFIEIIVQQAIAYALKNAKADKDWVIALTDADEDFQMGGTDLELTYRGTRLQNFTVLADLTLAKSYKIQEKKRAQEERENEKHNIFTVVSIINGSIMGSREEWYQECKDIIQSIKETGTPDWSKLSYRHNRLNIAKYFLQKIEEAIKSKIKIEPGKRIRAGAELEAIENLRKLVSPV